MNSPPLPYLLQQCWAHVGVQGEGTAPHSCCCVGVCQGFMVDGRGVCAGCIWGWRRQGWVS